MQDYINQSTTSFPQESIDSALQSPLPVYIPVPRKKFPILVTVLLILLAFVAAISVYLFVQVKELNTQLTATPTPLPTPIPTASVDPTSNWAIFTHPTQNYSVRYPSNVQVMVDNETRGNAIIVTSDNLDNVIGGIEVRELKVTPEQWINSQKKSGVIIIEKQTQTTPYTSGIKIKASSAMDYYAYIFSHNDMLYIVSLNIISENDAVLFDQIISTFKFINQVSIDTEQAIKTVIIDSTYADITLRADNPIKKDEIIVKITKIAKEHAVGTVSVTSGGGQVWFATLHDGKWTQVWAGQEPPDCDLMAEWKFPKDIFECSQ